MKKKIQVTTVEMKSNAEVIVLNSSFVAKTVRAAAMANELKAMLESNLAMIPKRDENDEEVKDENGRTVFEGDWEGQTTMFIPSPKVIRDRLCEFVIELENALLGEDE